MSFFGPPHVCPTLDHERCDAMIHQLRTQLADAQSELKLVRKEAREREDEWVKNLTERFNPRPAPLPVAQVAKERVRMEDLTKRVPPCTFKVPRSTSKVLAPTYMRT